MSHFILPDALDLSSEAILSRYYKEEQQDKKKTIWHSQGNKSNIGIHCEDTVRRAV